MSHFNAALLDAATATPERVVSQCLFFRFQRCALDAATATRTATQLFSKVVTDTV